MSKFYIENYSKDATGALNLNKMRIFVHILLTFEPKIVQNEEQKRL